MKIMMCPLSWETTSLVLSWGKATHLGYLHPQHGGCVMISCSAATSHNPCWPWTHSVAEDDLICLSLRSYSDYRCEPPHLNCRVTGMEARASGTLGQRSNCTFLQGILYRDHFLFKMGQWKMVILHCTELLLLKTCFRGFLGWKPTAQSLAIHFDWWKPSYLSLGFSFEL